MLSEDEYEAFRFAIEDAGYSPADFEISTADAGEDWELLNLQITKVRIRYLPNGITGTYKAGFGCYWLRQLQDDIKEGFYGNK